MSCQPLSTHMFRTCAIDQLPSNQTLWWILVVQKQLHVDHVIPHCLWLHILMWAFAKRSKPFSCCFIRWFKSGFLHFLVAGMVVKIRVSLVIYHDHHLQVGEGVLPRSSWPVLTKVGDGQNSRNVSGRKFDKSWMWRELFDIFQLFSIYLLFFLCRPFPISLFWDQVGCWLNQNSHNKRDHHEKGWKR